MTPQQISVLIDKIAWGHKYIFVKDSSGRELTLIVKALSLQSRNWVNFVYDFAHSEAIKSGFLTSKELLRQFYELGVWNEDDYSNLVKEIGNIKERLSSDDFSQREKHNLKSMLNGLSIKLDKLDRKKAELLASSSERHAEDLKIKAIIYSSIFKENGDNFWPSWDTFKEEPDQALLANIASVMFSLSSDKISDKKIREVARSPLWRYRWSAAKTIDYLFGKSIMDLTDEQSSLVYWSQLYDSVYEAYERPTDEIINDDDSLDEWLTSQSENRKKEIKEKFTESKVKKISSKTSRHSEVGLVVGPAIEADLARAKKMGLAKDIDTHSIEEVYDMNSELAKKFLGIQNKRIKQAGVIEERDLRHDADSRRVIGSQDAVISVRGGKKHVDKVLPGGTLKGRR